MSAYLTKSRFTLAVACPTKLWYYGNPGYVDNSKEDEFLKMLAEGGFQVGELAKAMFPDGVEVTDRSLEEQAARTGELFGQAQCTVFEGTIIHGNWLIRADILRKDGDTLELIEVKAKSFDSRKGDPETAWRSGRDGSIKADFLAYLQDVAFQTMVVRDAYPGLTVKPFLMLPDKAAAATVPGLNQMFRIHRTPDVTGGFRSRAEPVAGVSAGTIGSPILKRIDVSSFVEQILKEPLEIPGGSGDFRTLATEWAADHAAGRRIKTDIGPHCSNCQFRSEAPPPGMRSGFHECWSAALSGGRVGAAAPQPLVDLYHPNPGQLDKLFKAGRRTLGDLADEDLPTKSEPTGLTRSERRRLQVFGVNSSRPFFFDVDRWREAVAGFTWPLNFIDFEGARTALPLLKGGKPYQQIAFQFSHHVMERDGRVRHANEFIMLDPGKDPNVPFVRALREALTHPEVAGGTVFMWHHYERDVLNSLKDQLFARRQERTAPDDVDVLLEFLASRVAEDGPNAMVDMRLLADRLFFHPDTEGSSSIKVVLPAVLKASPWIKARYSQPVYGAAGDIPSSNFPISGSAGMVWWREDANGVMSPYKLLPPVFSDLPIGWEDEIPSDDSPAIADGGAAMTAYLRMQFTDVPTAERDDVRKGLLRYCELDTLAMVMVYEAWREWAAKTSPSSLFDNRRDLMIRSTNLSRTQSETYPRCVMDLLISCPAYLGDHYDVPVDHTVWSMPFDYYKVPQQGQTPRRPRAPFQSRNSLIPKSQVSHLDNYFGVYMLAINHPHKAFYVGIAAADSDKPEGVGSRIRKHRVKLTASHVGRTLSCGSPAGVGGVNHTAGWRPFAVERYQFHRNAGVGDCCADVRLMVGTAGDHTKKVMEQYESAILHNVGGVRSRIFDIFWPNEDNSNVVILNTIRGHAPTVLQGNIILPTDCP